MWLAAEAPVVSPKAHRLSYAGLAAPAANDLATGVGSGLARIFLGRFDHLVGDSMVIDEPYADLLQHIAVRPVR